MNLPKFLYAEDLDGDREFVIHNHWPRFIMEFIDGHGTGIAGAHLQPQPLGTLAA